MMSKERIVLKNTKTNICNTLLEVSLHYDISHIYDTTVSIYSYITKVKLNRRENVGALDNFPSLIVTPSLLSLI